MKYSIIVFFVTFVLHSDEFGITSNNASIENISQLEKEGKWNQALQIYKREYLERKNTFDGLSIKFMFSKGICELKSNEFNDAVKSFEWITSFDVKEIKSHNDRYHRTMAFYYIAEAQALSGKKADAEKSLVIANNHFDGISEYKDEESMKKAKKYMVSRIEETVKAIK